MLLQKNLGSQATGLVLGNSLPVLGIPFLMVKLNSTFIFTVALLHVHFVFSDFLFNFANVATNTAYKVKDSVKETVEKQVCGVSFNLTFSGKYSIRTIYNLLIQYCSWIAHTI